MSGMTLLNSVDDWTQHTRELSVASKLLATPVDWGPGPKEYPCLVASVQVSPCKFLSCYVYTADAVRLLPQTAQPVKAPVAKVVRQPGSDPGFARHVSALLLTIVEELIRIGITTEERFETLLTSRLATVDQVYATDSAKLTADLKGKGARVVLPDLFTDETET